MLMENIITNKKAAELMLISARIRRSALEMVYRATSAASSIESPLARRI